MVTRARSPGRADLGILCLIHRRYRAPSLSGTGRAGHLNEDGPIRVQGGLDGHVVIVGGPSAALIVLRAVRCLLPVRVLLRSRPRRWLRPAAYPASLECRRASAPVVNLSDEAAVLMLVDCDCRSTLSCDVASLAEGVRRQRIEQVPLLVVEVQIGTRDLVRAWAQPDFVAQLVGDRPIRIMHFAET